MPAPDEESAAWVTALSSDGRADACLRLRAVLLRAARSDLLRRARSNGQASRAALEDLATSATDNALKAIQRDLHTYRGQSRFTTWAAKFVLYEVGVQFQAHAWRDRPIPPEADGLAQLVDARRDGDVAAEQLCRVPALLSGRLTEHQRSVVIALALNDVPIDVLAERLGTTRGALYETLREARLAIRNGLSEASRDP